MIVEQMLKNAQTPLLHIADVSGSALFQGDCLDIMPLIPDNSIDCIITDPPYGTTACKWDTIIPFYKYVQIGEKVIYEQEYVFDKMKSGVSYKEALEDFFSISKDGLWDNYKRIIKDRGAIVLTASQPFTSALVMSNPKMFKHEWIWEKHKGTNFYQVKSAPMKVHESVLVFSKGTYTYNPQMVEGAPYKKRGSHHKLPKDHVMTPGKNIGYSDNLDTSKRYPTSVQFFSNHNQKADRFHPTQKPVALFEYLIKTYTNEGDLVLDNTAGSGTTCLAAKELNRKFIGIEKEPKYYEIACQRCGF